MGCSASVCLVALQALTHRTTAGLKEFRLMHAAHFRAHNKIIFPPTLRLLPLWTLGELSHLQHFGLHRRQPAADTAHTSRSSYLHGSATEVNEFAEGTACPLARTTRLGTPRPPRHCVLAQG